MDQLIAKYLSGEATDLEKQRIREWVAEKEENRSYYSQILNLWHVTHPAFDPQSIDVDEARRKLMSQISERKHLVFKKSLRILQRVAAVLFLPLFFLYIYELMTTRVDLPVEIAYQEVSSPFGGRSEVLLPDGTRVWLNAGGKLKYPLKFGAAERRVKLLGEAYFEVKSSEEHPFVVETDDLSVRATGTAFNVAAFDQDSIVSVTLIHGKVTVTDQKNGPTLLAPNDNYTFNKTSQKRVLKQVDVYKWQAWKDGILVFRNDRLDEVFKRLGQIYNVDIELKDPAQASVEFRATFENESLDQILSMIMKTTCLTYVRQEKRCGASAHLRERIEVVTR